MRTLVFPLLVLALAGCDAPKPADGEKGDVKSAVAANKAAPGADKAADKPEAKADAEEETKITQLGLTATLPAMSQVSDGIGGKGVMIIGTAPVNIGPAADDIKTVDDAKKDAADFTPKNFKDEKLSDGWVLTYENEGSAGTNYWLYVRREIGGKAYKCDTSVNSDEQRQNALKICKSLK